MGFNMIYFKKSENVIEKYVVEIDKEKFEPLQEEIIDNCSEIIHREEEYEDDIFERSVYPCYDVRNIECEKIDTQQYFDKTVNIYRYTYDEYVHPYLLDVYRGLKEEDPSALDELYNFLNVEVILEDLKKKIKEYEEIIARNNRFNWMASVKRKELLDEVKEVERRYGNIDKNKPYIEKILDCLSFKLIDSVSLDKVEEVSNFFELDDLVVYRNNKTKMKTRNIV